MKKRALIDEDLVRLIVSERKLMSELLHPFICTLHGHFQNELYLFMVLR
jgi:serine/threonine protein kinase